MATIRIDTTMVFWKARYKALDWEEALELLDRTEFAGPDWFIVTNMMAEDGAKGMLENITTKLTSKSLKAVIMFRSDLGNNKNRSRTCEWRGRGTSFI